MSEGEGNLISGAGTSLVEFFWVTNIGDFD